MTNKDGYEWSGPDPFEKPDLSKYFLSDAEKAGLFALKKAEEYTWIRKQELEAIGMKNPKDFYYIPDGVDKKTFFTFLQIINTPWQGDRSNNVSIVDDMLIPILERFNCRPGNDEKMARRVMYYAIDSLIYKEGTTNIYKKNEDIVRGREECEPYLLAELEKNWHRIDALGVDREYFKRLMYSIIGVESGFNRNAFSGWAYGLMQIGIEKVKDYRMNPLIIEQNVEMGIDILIKLFERFKDIEDPKIKQFLIITGYNQGEYFAEDLKSEILSEMNATSTHAYINTFYQYGRILDTPGAYERLPVDIRKKLDNLKRIDKGVFNEGTKHYYWTQKKLDEYGRE